METFAGIDATFLARIQFAFVYHQLTYRLSGFFHRTLGVYRIRHSAHARCHVAGGAIDGHRFADPVRSGLFRGVFDRYPLHLKMLDKGSKQTAPQPESMPERSLSAGQTMNGDVA